MLHIRIIWHGHACNICKSNKYFWFLLWQLEATWLYLRAGGKFVNGAATYDTEPRVLGDQLHATALQPGTPHIGSSQLLPRPDKTSGHMSLLQQRVAAQTGEDITERFMCCTVCHLCLHFPTWRNITIIFLMKSFYLNETLCLKHK